MSTSIVHRFVATRQARPAPLARTGDLRVRRIFDNSQIIERFEKWLLICGKAESTRKTYGESVRQFAKFIDKPLTAATKEDVRAFIGTLYAKALAASTIQVRLDALRVFGDCLQLAGLIRANGARCVSRRKLPKHLPRILSEDEINQLIAAARSPRLGIGRHRVSEDVGIRDQAIIELGYASGLRVNELAKLRIEDVSLPSRSLTVRQGKGGNDRVALFGRPAAEALRECIGDRTSGRVFVSWPRQQRGGVTRGKYGDWWGQWRENGKMRSIRLGDYEIPTKERARLALDAYLADKLPKSQQKGESLTARSIHRIILKVAKRAGIKGVHPHALRHAMATHCVDHEMDVRHVQELLGHTSLVATQKYLHTSTTKLKGVHTKFFPR